MDELPADLWSIQGQIPPPFESVAEKRWIAENKVSPYSCHETIPAAHRDRRRYRGQVLPLLQRRLHRIGEDVSERLDIVPAQFRVLVTRHPKYACRACEGAAAQAPAPARLIEGGLPTEATVAHVLVS